MMSQLAPPSPLPSILIIDDDSDALESMVTALAAVGYTVSAATSGVEAVAMLPRFPRPDLIVLDIVMPGMDGVDFRWKQLADPRLADVPVILVSARDNFARVAGRLRVQGMLAKPFDAYDLVQEVERVLRAI